MWKLDIINQGEIVAQHEDVEVKSAGFVFADRRVAGYIALDKDGNDIELIGGTYKYPATTSIERDENFVCIRGLWVHRVEISKFTSEGGVFGVLDEEGAITPAGLLLDDPGMRREWNLRPLSDSAGYAGTV